MPMIGSYETDNQVPSDDAFVPLVDGSLIRFDKEGFLEVLSISILTNFLENNIQCERLRLAQFLQQELMHSDWLDKNYSCSDRFNKRQYNLNSRCRF